MQQIHSTVYEQCTVCSGTSKIKCNICKGQGTTEVLSACTHGHGPNSSHYYCLNHGNDVSQYHK